MFFTRNIKEFVWLTSSPEILKLKLFYYGIVVFFGLGEVGGS